MASPAFMVFYSLREDFDDGLCDSQGLENQRQALL